jgi:hypothetical protein
MGDSSTIIFPFAVIDDESTSISKYDKADYETIDACVNCCIPFCCFPCWTIDKLCKKKSSKKPTSINTEKHDDRINLKNDGFYLKIQI